MTAEEFKVESFQSKIKFPNLETIIIKKENVTKQTNGIDCGLFALAFSNILASVQDPATIKRSLRKKTDSYSLDLQ